MHSAGLLAFGLAAAAVPLESAIRDDRVACAEPASDIDGDGIQDLACITRRGDGDPQRLVVVLSSAPARLALDAPVLGCPTCGGALGLSVRVESVSSTVAVEEQGGSREEWRHGLRLAHAAGAFRLTEEFSAVRDRISGAEVEDGTLYGQGPAESQRTLTPADGGGPLTSSWLDLYAVAPGAKVPPGSLRPQIEETLVDRADYLIAGAGSWSGATDLSFSVRARPSGPDVRIEIEVKDDDVKPGAQQNSDRVELWWDRGGDPWTADFKPKLRPDSRTTTGLSLRLLPGGKIGITRLFPANGSPPAVQGAWKPTPAGYSVQVRAARRVLTGPSPRQGLHTGETLVNATIIVRDSDAGDAEEAALATSKLEHRGAPFEMGRLHLPPSPR